MGGGLYTKDSMQSFINPSSFINLSNFNSINECIEYIEHVHQSPQAYLKILREKAFNIDVRAYYEKELEAFFDNIFAQPKVSKISQGQFKLAYKNYHEEYRLYRQKFPPPTEPGMLISLLNRIKNKIKRI